MSNNWVFGALVYGFAGVTILTGIGSFVVLGAFLSKMSLGMVHFGLGSVAAAVLDVALCALFFLQHSGMVRRSFRAWSERWIPRWLSRALYTFTSAFALALLCLFWQPVDTTPLVLSGGLSYALRATSLAALLSFLWAFVSIEGFDAFGTGDVLARYRGRDRVPSPLTVKGPYRWVRHPFYFLAIVLLWSTPVISGDRLLFNALFTVWIVLGSKWEEQDLIAQYGDPYRYYQKSVPMLLPWRVPGANLAMLSARLK